MAKTSSTKPLRVLHVTKWYPNHNDVQNGVFIQKHIKASARFSEVKVLAWLPGSDLTETRESNEEGVAVTRTWFKAKTPISAKRHAFREYISTHYNNKALPDVIHLHVFSADLLVIAYWARKKNIPLVISEHWSGYSRGLFKAMPKWRRWAFKKLGELAYRILPVSTFLQDEMIAQRIKGNYEVVPNVVENVDYKSTKNTNFAFVMVSDLVDEIKNVSGVINAFETLDSKEASLNIIGGGPDEEMIRKQIAISPKKAQIKAFGRLPNNEVLELLPSFHSLVCNSRIESFGVTVLEAHAAGLPVISTRCGGPDEWLEKDDISINIDDEKALVAAMFEMLNRGDETYDFTKHLQCLPEVVSTRLNIIYNEVIEESKVTKKGKKLQKKTKKP